MSKNLQKFTNWCGKYRNVFGFIIALFAIIAFVQYNSVIVGSALTHFFKIANYLVCLPIWLIIALIILLILFVLRIKRKYKTKKITQDFLVGTWKNEWYGDHQGSEICNITGDLRYFVGGTHYFNLVGFSYDQNTNSLSFTKVGAQPGDNRRVTNVLTIHNNNFLTGIENSYPIKYSRISDSFQMEEKQKAG
jgi:hypothetical protein